MALPTPDQSLALPFDIAVGVGTAFDRRVRIELPIVPEPALLHVQSLRAVDLAPAASQQRDLLAPARDQRVQVRAGAVEIALHECRQCRCVEHGKRVFIVPGGKACHGGVSPACPSLLGQYQPGSLDAPLGISDVLTAAFPSPVRLLETGGGT